MAITETTDISTQETTDSQSEINSLKAQKAEEEKAVKDNLVRSSDPYDKYAHTIISEYAKPAIAEGMVNKDTFFKLYTDRYIQEFAGDKSKATDAMEKQYELISKSYQNQAAEEHEFKILENMSYMARGMSDVEIVSDYSPEIYEEESTISGRKELLGNWTDPTKTVEQATLQNKKVIDYKGDFIDYKEDAYSELVGEDKYTNDKGKKIIAFTYVPSGNEFSRDSNLAIKAVYEGETPDGEIVSRYDTADSILSGNGLDTSLWKVGVGSVIDFIIDTLDTAAAIVQYTMLGASLGYAEDTEFYKDFRDMRTQYGAASMMSKSKADKESMFTINNALSLGINVAGQLFTGRLVAKGMSKLVKVGKAAGEDLVKTNALFEVAKVSEDKAIDAVSKLAAKNDVAKYGLKLIKQQKALTSGQNKVRMVTLASMSAMQAKETADEAARLGFSPSEQAMIYFASLGSQMYANKFSDVGFEKLGMHETNSMIKKKVGEALYGIKPSATGVSKIFNKTASISGKIKDGVSTLLSKKGIFVAGVREGLQEETEYIFDELVRHTATALKSLGYEADPPKFKTAFDEGYWSDFAINSVMNMGVGAIAGSITSAISGDHKFKLLDDDKLPQKGTTAELIKKIAYFSHRTERGISWESQFRKELDKQLKKGSLGREDISTKWDNENKRYKRTNELTDADKMHGHTSQAMTNYIATLSQFEYYKHIYAQTSEKFDAVKAIDPRFEEVMNSNTMYEKTKDLYEQKARIYMASSSKGTIDFDNKLRDLQKIHDKLKDSEEDVSKDEKYNAQITELAAVTNLSNQDIQKLVDINSDLDDINSGKFLENAFIHYMTDQPKFKGKLDFLTIKKLLASDTKSQNSFVDKNNKNFQLQEEFDKLIKTGINPNGTLTEEFISKLKENEDNLFLSPETRGIIAVAISSMGNNIEAQKMHLYDILLRDLKITIDKAFDNDGGINVIKNYDQVDDASAKAFLYDLIERLRRAGQQGGDAITKLISSIEGIELDRNQETFKFLLILNKLLEVNKPEVMTQKDFEHIKYNINKDFLSDTAESRAKEHSFLEAMIDEINMSGGNFSGFSLYPPDSDANDPHIGLTIGSEEEFRDILDPERNRKKELENLISSSSSHNIDHVRHDLMYGFIKTPTGEIEHSDYSLVNRLSKLQEAVKEDKKTNTRFFGDTTAALNLQEQIDVRLAEVEFLSEMLPVLSKVNTLNKTILNNKKKSTTFLSNYVENYIVNLEDFDSDRSAVFSELNGVHAELTLLKKGVTELLTLSSKTGEDLEKVYSGRAMERAKIELNHIDWVLTTDNAPNIEELRKQIAELINNIDFADFSKENITATYEIIYKVKKLLNEAHKADDKLLKNLSVISANTNKTREVKTLLRYALAPVDDVNAHINKTITELIAAEAGSLENAVLPTIDQLAWIEEMLTATIAQDFLNDMIISNRSEDDQDKFNSGIFYSGKQGAGKSRVIIKYAAEIVQKYLANNTQENDGMQRQIAFASDTVDMRKSMIQNIDEKKVAIHQKFKTQKDLYDYFVVNASNLSPKAMADDLKDLGIIFFDEISLVESVGTRKEALENPKGENVGVLNGILAQLEKINEHRKGNKLLLIGTGDDTQPGFVAGMKSPRNSNPVQTKPETQNAFRGPSTIKSEIKLADNFRSKVNGMAETIQKFQNSFINRTVGKLVIPVSTFVYDVTPERHLGIRIFTNDKKPRSFRDIATDDILMKDIEAKILADDKKFSVAIAIGENDDDLKLLESETKDTKLEQLMKKYPEYFTIYSISNIQGSEADYVLSYLPEDFFGYNSSKVIGGLTSEQQEVHAHKISLFKVLLGRARYFSDVAMSATATEQIRDVIDNKKDVGNVHITDTSYSAAFKKDWGAKLTNSILLYNDDNIGFVNAPITVSQSVNNSSTVSSAPTMKKDEPGSAFSPILPTDSTVVITASNPDLQIVNELGLIAQSRNNFNYLIEKYKFLITGIEAFNSGSVDDIMKLKDMLQSMMKSKAGNTGSIKAAKELLEQLNDMDAAILEQDDDKIVQALDEDLGGKPIVRTAKVKKSEESISKSEKALRVMLDAQDKEHSLAVYQDFDTTNMDDDSEKLRRLRQIFKDSDTLNIVETKLAVEKAFKYVKKGNSIEFEIDSKKFKFSIVTTVSERGSGVFKNNYLIGTENSTGKKFMIGQLPISDDLLDHPEQGSKYEESLKVILLNRTKLLNESLVKGFEFKKHPEVSKGQQVNYIETSISPNAIKGLTVGNLITSDKYVERIIAQNSILRRPFFSSKDITKLFENINKLIKNDYSTSLTDPSFPLEPVNKGKLFIPYKNTYYCYVKTSNGVIPFIKENKKWIPIIGVDHFGEIYTGDKLLNEKDDINYNEHLVKISNALTLLSVDEQYIGTAGKTASDIRGNINNKLGIGVSILEDIKISKSKAGKSLILYRNFKNMKSNLLEDVKLSFAEAKDLIKTTSKNVQFSVPKILTKGEHRGKSVVFYTLTPISGLELETLSSKELLDLYEKVNQEKNTVNQSLSFGRFGIGVMLLDSPGKTLTEIVDNHPDPVLKTTSAAHMNKIMLSGDAQRKFIKLLAVLHNKLYPGKSDVVSEIISEKDTGITAAKIIAQDKIIGEWVTANRDGSKRTPGFTMMEVLLDHIFLPESLGALVVTHAVSPELADILYQLRFIRTHYSTTELSKENIDKAASDTTGNFTNIDNDVDFLIKELYINNYELFKSVNLSEGNLRGIITHEAGIPGATGSIGLTKKGELLVEKGKFPIITAINKGLVERIDPKLLKAVPANQFNMYAFVEFINTLKNGKLPTEDISEALATIDDLLLQTEFPHGIFVSPSIVSTSLALGDIEGDFAAEENSFITDVKRIKQPQVILDTTWLMNALMAPTTKTTTTTISVVPPSTSQKSINEIIQEQLSGNPTKEVFENAMVLVNDSDISLAEKNQLLEQIYAQYLSSIPTISLETKFNDIDLSVQFLSTPETAEFISSLNILRDLAISEDIKNIIFKTLLRKPNEFIGVMVARLWDITAKYKVKKLSDKQASEVILKLSKSENIQLIKRLINKPIKGIDIFSELQSLISSQTDDNYPVNWDMSPKNRALLLIGTLTKTDDNSDNTIFTKDQVSAVLANDITSTGYPELRLKNAIDFRSITPNAQSLIPMTLEEFDILMSNDNLWRLSDKTIAQYLHRLSNTADLKYYNQFLTRLGKDLNKISYNKEVKAYGHQLIAEAAKIDTLSLETIIEQQLEEIKYQNEINNLEVIKMKEDINDVKTILTDIKRTKLNSEDHTNLVDVINDMDESMLLNLSKFMDGSMTIDEYMDMATLLAHIVAEKPITVESKENVIEAISNISTEITKEKACKSIK